ncbi:MAG: nitrous oxide reductase accessory protein NosL [Magnetococcales bacterium]|nr:nitrous oxide reductase accessory protein NosL [Magnetococcales bacterium]
MSVRRFLFPLCVLFLLAACGQQEQGPEPIHWNRDVCERCRMMISDPHYAAQLRDARGKPHLFDDFGDLVLWLKEHDQLQAPLILYVADQESGQWLDARKARYVKGQLTPMGFGMAAHAQARPGDMSFQEAVTHLLASPAHGGRTPEVDPPSSSPLPPARDASPAAAHPQGEHLHPHPHASAMPAAGDRP